MERWFHSLFGFEEHSYGKHSKLEAPYLETQSSFEVRASSTGGNLVLESKVNGAQFEIGKFGTPSLGTLREQVRPLLDSQGESSERCTSFAHIATGDVLTMHAQNKGATFQAASQFNCLEFANPEAVPEQGVTIYYGDRTQGPACSLACAAGTVYRNYFFPVVPGQVGQRRESQINNLDDLAQQLGSEGQYWTIRNGYSYSTQENLAALSSTLESRFALQPQSAREELLACIKIGVHQDCGVTFASRSHSGFEPVEDDIRVTQCFCSALSCAYSGVENSHWATLAQLVLDAEYEATLWAAVLNRARGGSRVVFLTFLGGGVFGNADEWIGGAIGRAIGKATKRNADLDVRICHFRNISERMVQIVQSAYEIEMSQA